MKTNLGKHLGYMDSLIAKLNKVIFDHPNESNNWLFKEIIETHKKIKDDLKEVKHENLLL